MPRTSEKRLAWEKSAWRVFSFKLSRTRDRDKIEYLEGQPSMNGFIKGLIEEHMKSNKA